MHRVERKEREQFISLIAQHSNECKDGSMNCFVFARKLLRYGATYGRIQETACNAPEQHYGQDWLNERRMFQWNKMLESNEKKEKRIEMKLTEMCEKFGCVPVFQGDPRGNTVKIAVPDGYTNDWGREGICVPTS